MNELYFVDGTEIDSLKRSINYNLEKIGGRVNLTEQTLADAQTPSAHAASHASGQSDQLTLDNLAGTLAITKGGTGSTTAADARAALGLGSIATQAANSVSISGGAITGITDLAIADGGTGSSTAAAARAALSIEYITENKNVKDPAYGPVVDGDYTLAIFYALAPGATVYFPPGTYKTGGGYNINGFDGLKVVGSGAGNSVIDITNAGNDLFYILNTHTKNLTIEGFTVTSSTVTRTTGWVFACVGAYDSGGYLLKSRFKDIEIKNQVNGLWIARYEFVWIDRVMGWNWVGSGGIGIKAGQTTASDINQGSELYINHTQIYGNNLLGGAPILGTGYLIEDCDAVYLNQAGAGGCVSYGLRGKANAGGHSPSCLSLVQCVGDNTKDVATCDIQGFANVCVSDSQFCAAGQVTGGSVNARGMYIGNCAAVRLTNNQFANNSGTGLSLYSSNGVVSNNTFFSNGLGAQASNNHAIIVEQTSLNDSSFSINGCMDLGSNGVSIRTNDKANKLVVVGNRWVSGVQYDVAPGVNANNLEA